MTTSTRSARSARLSSSNRIVSCRSCGRRTHSDLDGCIGLALCRECREEAEMENDHMDGVHEEEAVAGCAGCADSARRAEVRAEQADAVRVEAFNALPRAEREEAVRDIPVVSAPDCARLGTIEAVHESTLSVRWENGDAEVVARSGAVVARSQSGLGEEWSVGDEVREIPVVGVRRVALPLTPGAATMTELLYTQVDLMSLIHGISQAIEKHGKFEQVYAPEFRMRLDGCGFSVKVKIKGSRKRSGDLSESGDSPWEAAEKLISGLDHWFEALS